LLYTKYVIKDSLCKELHMKKTISKILIALVSTVMVSAATAGPGHHGNYVGPVPPVGNVVYYGGHHHGNRNGCYGSNCALVVLGSVALGAVIANEMRRQPDVVYVPAPPPPQIVYVPSQYRCDGGVVINGIYHCPRYAN
jgi:uncharacterized membrane protein YjjB (DUF3815 family)